MAGLRRLGWLVLIAALGTAGCASRGPADDSLYRALGERAGIVAIVDSLLYRIGEDARIIHHFEESNLDRLHEKLVEHVCMLSGGPCDYTGDSMTQVHCGMGLVKADLNALVEDLIAAMEDEKVPLAAQNRLLALLAPMHAEVLDGAGSARAAVRCGSQ